MNIVGTDRESKCMYCDSPSYGMGCVYSPNTIHVHVDDPKRCVWCGTTAVGKGCVYNPFSDTHQKGIVYNPVMIEAMENGITQGLIMRKLSQPITETAAFKMGLIDDRGNTIKIPETIEERKALTGVDKYLIKVRNLLKEKIDILNLTLYYENKELDSIEDIQTAYPMELECRADVNKCITTLKGIMEEYSEKGISSALFEQMIVESLTYEK